MSLLDDIFNRLKKPISQVISPLQQGIQQIGQKNPQLSTQISSLFRKPMQTSPSPSLNLKDIFQPIQPIVPRQPAPVSPIVTRQIPNTKLPSLYTEGPQVKRRDTGEPVQLKGATSNAFRYPWQKLGYKSIDDVINRVKTVKDAGGNVVNLYIDQDQLKNNMDNLDKVIEWADSNGVYVSLYPIAPKEKGGDYADLNNPEYKNLPAQLATRYKDKKNLLYGLWAEPQGYSNEEWVPKAAEMTKSLRSVNPDAPVIMSGQYNSRDLNDLKTKPFPFDNVIYDFHDYPFADEKMDQAMGGMVPEFNQSHSQWMEGKYPVLQGEFGKYWGNDFSSPKDLEFIQQKINDANKKNQGVFGYALDEPGGLGLLDEKGNLTKKGEIFYKDLKSNPPTDFSKTTQKILVKLAEVQKTPSTPKTSLQDILSPAANETRPLVGRAAGYLGERGFLGRTIQQAGELVKTNPQTTEPIANYAAGLSVLSAERLALGKRLPDTPGMRKYRTAGGLTGGLLTSGPGGVAASGLFGAGATGVINAGQNILSGKPWNENLPKSLLEGGATGVETSQTYALTNAIVNKLANTLPFAQAISDTGIARTLPQKTQTISEAIKNIGTTGLKRAIKAALIETPIEGIVYGVKDQKDNQKLIDSIVEETKKNLIFNVSFAGANTAWDARVIAPILDRSVNQAVKQLGQQGQIDLSAPVGGHDPAIVAIVNKMKQSGMKALSPEEFKTLTSTKQETIQEILGGFAPGGRVAQDTAFIRSGKTAADIQNGRIIENPEAGFFDPVAKLRDIFAKDRTRLNAVGQPITPEMQKTLAPELPKLKPGETTEPKIISTIKGFINSGNFTEAAKEIDALPNSNIYKQPLLSLLQGRPTHLVTQVPDSFSAKPQQILDIENAIRKGKYGQAVTAINHLPPELASLKQSYLDMVGQAGQGGFFDPNAEISNPFKKERGFVTSVQENPALQKPTKKGVTGSYQVKPNDELMGEAKALLSEGASIDFKNTKNLDQKIAATIQEALNLDAKGKHGEAAALFNNLSTQGTELGRGVQAFSLLDKMSPQSIALSAAGKINKYNATASRKIPELTGEQQKMISKSVEAIRNMADGKEKNIAIHELNDRINEFIPSSIADKLITVWKAGLLTSLRTHERNLLGNTIMGGFEIGKDPVASVADYVMSLKTGKRSMTTTLEGLLPGAKKGSVALKDILQRGYDPEDAISKFDVHRITWGKGPVEQFLKKATDAVYRPLAGEDKIFWHSAYGKSLYDQAGAEAINAGKEGSSQFIESLVKNATPEMKTVALRDANYATFHDKNVLTNVASAIKRAAQDPRLGRFAEVGKVATEVLAPFTGVPSSIVGKTAAYSPIGLIRGAIDTGRVLTGNVPELQRQAAQEVGRGVLGTGLFGLGAYLMNKGLMTGQPKDQKEAELWQAQNKPSNSIMVDGKWRSINSIGPQNLIVLAGAKYQEEVNNPEGSLGQFALKLGKDQLAQTFLSGIQQPLAALTDPARYGKSYVGNLLSSTVPNIIKDTSKAFDPTARETNTSTDYLKVSIPGVRNRLLPKRDVLGNIIAQEPTGIEAFLDVFNSKTPVNDKTINEITRLYEAGQEAIPSKMGISQTIGKQKIKLTFEQLNNLEAGVGELVKPMLEGLIDSPVYQGVEDDIKAELIDRLITQVRKQYKTLHGDEILKEEQKSDLLDSLFQVKGARASDYESSVDAPQNLLDRITLAARGIGVDPKNTIKAIFTEEKMRKIAGNAMILERKQYLNKTADTSDAVDHIVPLSLGGDNSPENTRYISKEENAEKAKLETKLAKDLKNGKVTKEEARKQVADWVDKTMEIPISPKKEVSEYPYLDPKSGTLKSVRLSFSPPEVPKLTGNKILDKELLSDFGSEVTKEVNNVMERLDIGKITQEEAISQLEALQSLRNSVKKKGTGTGSKKLLSDIFNSIKKERDILAKLRSETNKPLLLPRKSNLASIDALLSRGKQGSNTTQRSPAIDEILRKRQSQLQHATYAA